MAISHIPRTVGHNFVPEYQISALPYAINTSDANTQRIVVRKTDGLVVGTVVHGQNAITTNNALEDSEIFNDPNGNGVIEANEKTTANLKNTFSVIKKIEFPKIVQWIKFYSPLQSTLTYYFSRNHCARTTNGLTVKQTFKGVKVNNTDVFESSSTIPLNLRFVNLYLVDGADETTQILAGLTSIDRSEFTDVIERFLGDS